MFKMNAKMTSINDYYVTLKKVVRIWMTQAMQHTHMHCSQNQTKQILEMASVLV